ncbi:MAG: hypothetical protein ACXWWC_13060, partial [Chitinophagaceae bacterium]
VLKMKLQLLKLRSAIEKKMLEIKAPADGYANLKTETRIYEALLGIRDDIPDDAGHKINPHLFQVKLNDYKIVLDAYWKDVEPLHLLYMDVYGYMETFEEVLERFDQRYSRPLFKHYENMEIDICSFDDDQNEFRERWMEVYKLYENTVDEYADWLNLHNTMATNINTLYNRITKIFNHIRDLQNFNKEKIGDAFSSN